MKPKQIEINSYVKNFNLKASYTIKNIVLYLKNKAKLNL